MKANLLACLAGLVAALGFAPVGAWPLTLGAVAALLWLVRQAPGLRSALTRGWWFGAGHFTLGLNWIATAFTYQSAMPAWLGWVSVVLLSLYLAVYPAAAAGLAWRYGRGNGAAFALLFAAAWIVTEWLRATMFTGFAWNPLGVVMLPTATARLSTVVGTYGLSGAAVLLAGGLMLVAARHRAAGYALLGGIAVASLATLPFAVRPAPGRATPLTIVQPNIGQEEKWSPSYEARSIARLRALSRSRGAAPGLLLWPEMAVTSALEDGRRDPAFAANAAAMRRAVAASVRPGDILLTGGLGIRSANGREISGASNSAFVLDARGAILARYDKAHLVPYGEYLPARPILSRFGLSRLAPGSIDFDSGPGARSLTLPGFGKAGVQICYEIIFSGAVVDRGDRPDFLFNPSNDAWFGRWGPPQHLAQARLRAIEEALPVVRATPTGISAVIDANGVVLASLPWRTRGAIRADLPRAGTPTPFARAGNIAPLLFALALAGIAIAVRRRQR